MIIFIINIFFEQLIQKIEKIFSHNLKRREIIAERLGMITQ